MFYGKCILGDNKVIWIWKFEFEFELRQSAPCHGVSGLLIPNENIIDISQCPGYRIHEAKVTATLKLNFDIFSDIKNRPTHM